jgi:hypothetical protein
MPLNDAAPTNSPAAPAPTQAPAIPSTPASDPLAGLVNPAQPSLATAATNSAMQAFEAEKSAADKAAQIANTPVSAPPPPPHAKLLAMVNGLSLGLSAFGTAAATHGREGGYQEVAEVQAQQQQQKLQAQQAAENRKNQALQQQITIGQVNHQLGQNALLLATLPTDLQAHELELEGEQQKVAAGKTTAAQTSAEFLNSYGMTPDAFNSMLSGDGSATDPKAVQNLTSFATQKVNAASQILGANDSTVQQAQQVLANPQSTPQQIFGATAAVNRAISLKGAVTDAQIKQNQAAQNAPFGQSRADALNSAMLQRYQVLNPNAPALPRGLAMSANSTPQDFDRADKVLQQTENSAATQAQRDTVNAMRQQTLALSGMGAVGGNPALSGGDYLKSLPATEATLVSSVGTGKIAPDRMAYLIARNPKLLQEITLAYPDFDSSKAAAYPGVYKDFTSGKTSTALNAGGTALGHLYELLQLNTPASHLPGTPAYTAYQNKAATVSTELAKFYGDATVPAIENIQKTLTSTLPGNREAAIRTQAQSMGDKLDAFEQQWKNAAPSSAYEASMPGISDKAKAARAALDPNYARSQQANNFTRIKASDGTLHDIPTANLDAARKIDPNLQVVTQ